MQRSWRFRGHSCAKVTWGRVVGAVGAVGEAGGIGKVVETRPETPLDPLRSASLRWGGKRKCDTEPDGGPDVRVHGASVPTIAPAKKVEADES